MADRRSYDLSLRPNNTANRPVYTRTSTDQLEDPHVGEEFELLNSVGTSTNRLHPEGAGEGLEEHERRLARRTPVQRVILQLKKLASRSTQWQRTNRFAGWRLGVLVGCITSTVVCLLNIMLMLLSLRYGGYTNGIAEIARGSASSISTLNTRYHVLINVLSTILLGASNYCSQVLTSPTRKEIDKAHAEGRWLDVGILSIRNLRHISRRRLFLSIALTLSSLPLHLFYNSAVFAVTTGSTYSVKLVDISSDEFRLLNTTETLRNLTNAEWRDAYGVQYVSAYSDLYLIVDSVAFEVHLNETHSVPNISVTDAFPSEILDDPANNSSIFALITVDEEDYAIFPSFYGQNNVTTKLHVSYAFAVATTENSAVQISLYFMLIVVICNITKATAMLLTFLDGGSARLVTMGDAVASFLEAPDWASEGFCVASRNTLLGLPDDINPGAISGTDLTEEAEEGEQRGHLWQPRRLYRGQAISPGRSSASTLLCFCSVLALVILFCLFQPSIDSGWGSASTTTLEIGINGFDAAGILLNAWIANVPQLLLSVIYLSFNALYTSISLAQEWNGFASKRKGLRVTRPSGEQRGTYFLQLPYRWGLPLTLMGGILHWLISQSFFLVRVDVRDSNGELNTNESISTCGISGSSLLTLTVVGTMLFGFTCFISWLKFDQHLPFAVSCSAVISAACHPPTDDNEAHLKKVQWGVT